MKKLIFIAITIVALSCKGEFVPEVYGKSYTETKEEGCVYCGFCSGVKFDGTYGYGSSCSCAGTKTVEYWVTPVFGYYEKQRDVNVRVLKKIVINSSNCQ